MEFMGLSFTHKLKLKCKEHVFTVLHSAVILTLHFHSSPVRKEEKRVKFHLQMILISHLSKCNSMETHFDDIQTSN